jgi:hypothetical protein
MAKQKTKRTVPLIKTQEGKYVYGREETETILSMLQRTHTEGYFKEYKIIIVDDIETEDGREITIKTEKVA